MKRNFFCGSADHSLDRRGFLGAAIGAGAAFAADMTGINSILSSPAVAAELKQQQKRCIMLWMSGGASQLETFDPTPGVSTGGPFRAIPTNVPGIYISELMPKMAQRMQHTCIIRSLNTKNGDHAGGARLMMLGRRDEPNLRYPDLGAVLAKELGRADSQVPDYVWFYSQTEGHGMAPGTGGFLGARYTPMERTTSMMPENIRKLGDITDLDFQERNDLRNLLSKQFEHGRTSSTLSSHNEAYLRVRGLMASEKLFDISQESQKMRDRYGPTQFAEQVLAARRLVESGVPFVCVARSWWGSQVQKFETH